MTTRAESSKEPANGSPPSEKSGVEAKHPPQWRASLEKIRSLTNHYPPWSTLHKYKVYRRRPKEVPLKSPPFILTLLGSSGLLAFELSILIVITILWILTTKYNGFVDVPDTPSSIFGSNFHGALLWTYSLLWTFLPASVVSACGTLFNIAVQALERCQPTIELRKQVNSNNKTCSCDLDNGRCLLPVCSRAKIPLKQEKSTAKLTVLLDYGDYWFPFCDTVHAFCNKHCLIAFCTMASWFFAAIGPLSAAVISTANVPSSRNIQLTSTTQFDGWKDEITSRLAFDSASALLLNNGSPYPWTTEVYSVVPFFANVETGAGNLTTNTLTYSASLDCQLIDVGALLTAGNITVQPSDGGNETDFEFYDRGCTVTSDRNAYIIIVPDTPLYSQSRFATCPFDADQARFILMSGSYDPSSPYLLGDFSLISCIPYFWDSTSQVTIPSAASTQGKYGQIINLIPDISSFNRSWPNFWNTWMSQIPDYTIHDPAVPIESDDFGLIVYNYASNNSIDLIQAMNTTFSVLYAAFATTSTYDALPENVTFTGTFSQPANRLFVVFAPALVVTLAMSFSLLVTVWIAVFAYQHRVELQEQLDLISGHAILLEENVGVKEYLEVVREDIKREAALVTRANADRVNGTANSVSMELAADHAVRSGDLVKYAKQTKRLNEWKCWVEDGKLHMAEPEPQPPSLTFWRCVGRRCKRNGVG